MLANVSAPETAVSGVRTHLLTYIITVWTWIRV